MNYLALRYKLKVSPFGPTFVEHEQIIPATNLDICLTNLKSPVIGAIDIEVSTAFSFMKY